MTELYTLLMFQLLYPEWTDASVPHLRKSAKAQDLKKNPRVITHFLKVSFVLHHRSQRHKALKPKAETSERLMMTMMVQIILIY